jgi:hypothetical protein
VVLVALLVRTFFCGLLYAAYLSQFEVEYREKRDRQLLEQEILSLQQQIGAGLADGNRLRIAVKATETRNSI